MRSWRTRGPCGRKKKRAGVEGSTIYEIFFLEKKRLESQRKYHMFQLTQLDHARHTAHPTHLFSSSALASLRRVATAAALSAGRMDCTISADVVSTSTTRGYLGGGREQGQN